MSVQLPLGERIGKDNPVDVRTYTLLCKLPCDMVHRLVYIVSWFRYISAEKLGRWQHWQH
jgi:hypothetical protein